MNREAGRAVIEKLCRAKHHLKVPANVYVKKTSSGQQVDSPVTIKGQEMAINGQVTVINEEMGISSREVANGQEIALNGQDMVISGQEIAINGQDMAINSQEMAINSREAATNDQYMAKNGQKIIDHVSSKDMTSSKEANKCEKCIWDISNDLLFSAANPLFHKVTWYGDQSLPGFKRRPKNWIPYNIDHKLEPVHSALTRSKKKN